VCTTLPTTTFEIPGDPDSPVIPTCTTFNGQVNVTVNCAASATLKGD
jgi:hypothetical protein